MRELVRLDGTHHTAARRGAPKPAADVRKAGEIGHEVSCPIHKSLLTTVCQRVNTPEKNFWGLPKNFPRSTLTRLATATKTQGRRCEPAAAVVLCRSTANDLIAHDGTPNYCANARFDKGGLRPLSCSRTIHPNNP